MRGFIPSTGVKPFVFLEAGVRVECGEEGREGVVGRVKLCVK